jgi:hypothetical protein
MASQHSSLSAALYVAPGHKAHADHEWVAQSYYNWKRRKLKDPFWPPATLWRHESWWWTWNSITSKVNISRQQQQQLKKNLAISDASVAKSWNFSKSK